MKLVILGSNGMLGSYLERYFSNKYDLLCLTRKDIDLSINSENILSYFNSIIDEGDIIINSAGVIKQRNYNIREMIMVNSILPHLLNEIKKINKCEVIHITTDCVFSGLEGYYDENSKHDCLDDYGKSKSIGENSNNTNIRTSIIGEEKYNKKSLIEWVLSNKNGLINGYTNHLWNGLTCLELCKYIDNLISKNEFWEGTRHVGTKNIVSKYELVNMINDVYNLNIIINKSKTDVNCFRNLNSIHNSLIEKDLLLQIKEQKNFKI